MLNPTQNRGLGKSDPNLLSETFCKQVEKNQEENKTVLILKLLKEGLPVIRNLEVLEMKIWTRNTYTHINKAK